MSRLSGEFAQKQAGLEEEIKTLAGEPLNPGSPKQFGDILFGKMGLPGGTKTKTGQWSTGARALEELAEQGHELPRKILDWRQVSKLRSTYTEALPTYINPTTGRVHTSYALAATTTGRLSSSEPNLQNIPVRTEDGRKIRKAFVASPGMKLVSADYSQIELRLLSEVAEVPALRQAFQDGVDIHAMTASEMFGVPVKDMPGEIRRRAKAINFGIIYGISAFGLANQLCIAREEAGAYIKKYFERFPGIRDYMDETREFCREHGYVETLFGRKCHYPEIKNSQSVDPLVQRARRDQRAPARLRRRHHPPRHDAHGGRTGEGQAQGADAAAGARRIDLRSAGRRSGQDPAGGQARDGRRAAPGGGAARCRCRSTPAPPTIGTRRISSFDCAASHLPQELLKAGLACSASAPARVTSSTVSAGSVNEVGTLLSRSARAASNCPNEMRADDEFQIAAIPAPATAAQARDLLALQAATPAHHGVTPIAHGGFEGRVA